MLKGIFDKSKNKQTKISDDLKVYNDEDIEFLTELLNTKVVKQDVPKDKETVNKNETPTPRPTKTNNSKIEEKPPIKIEQKTVNKTVNKIEEKTPIKRENRKFPNKMNNYSFRYIKNLKELRELSIDLSQKTCLEFDCTNKIMEKGLVCLYSSLIGYIYYDCLTEEQELNSLIELFNAMEYKKYYDLENAIDLIFEDLAEIDPEHFALRQYIMFSHLSYEQKSEIVFMANYYLNNLLCETGYKKYVNTKRRKAEIIDFTTLNKKKVVCDKCGDIMLPRTQKRISNTGERLFVCINYPKCKSIKMLKQ